MKYDWQTPAAQRKRKRDAAKWMKRRRERLTSGVHRTPLLDRLGRLTVMEDPLPAPLTWLERMKNNEYR